ncbi:MAG: hypothetical protein ACE5IL_09975 [Myxococcota bacterium]
MRICWLALVPLAAALGCGPTVVRQPVFDNGSVKVILRHVEKDGAPLPRGFEQPVTIADVRLAHILASLSFGRGKTQGHAIRTDQIYDLAEGIGKALRKAGPDDEVLAWTFSHDRRLVVFSQAHRTALRVVQKDGQLQVRFYAIEATVTDQKNRDRYEPPLRAPDTPLGVRLKPDRAQLLIDDRTLAIDWRDPFYRQPTSLRARHGRLSRRTVLMREEETPEEKGATAELAPIPPRATDDQIRALDELDGARRGGLITEQEFKRRRRLILQGRLEEAGYGRE